jgi:transposase-like protein
MTGHNHYSESLKREVVIQVQSGQISKEEARRKYGIRGHSTILKWIRKFEESDPHLQSLMDYSKSDKKELIKRIKELERKLEDEQIRSFGYSKMIDIAEEQLKVPIRKKPDTKQSKK